MARHIDAETAPSLLMRMRDHADEGAWSSFMEVYGPLVYNFCRIRNLQSADAADVTQEVLVRVARGIRNFEYDANKGLFRDWVARIVNNEIARHASKKARSPIAESEIQEVGHVADWDEHFHQHILEAALSRCEHRFTPETWQLFELSWIQQMPASKAATQAGVGIDKVYWARSRVLKQLRHEVMLLAEDIVSPLTHKG